MPAEPLPDRGDGPRKILLISFLFPPAGGIAVQRALSFAKYLSRLGLEMHVLSAGTAGAPVIDQGLLRHVPAEVRLYRAFAPVVPFALRQMVWKLLHRGNPPRREAGPAAETAGGRRSLRGRIVDLIKQMICPDPEVLWMPFALRKASQIIRKYGIDTVLVTAPPFSAFLTGNALKRRFPHIRLVSDFRDDWVGFYLKEFSGLNNPQTTARSQRMERNTAEQSDLVVVVTEAMLRDYRNRYPGLPPERFALIPNGYDPESIPAAAGPRKGDGPVVFTFTGTVYPAASPRTFLEGVGRLPEALRRRIEARFVGRVAASERPLLEAQGEWVRLLGFLPQAEALAHLQASDYLLVIMTDPGALTGKVFEYMASGRPILALAPTHGEIARILQETRTGWCVDPYDVDAIARTVGELVERAGQGGSEWSPDWERIRRYARPRLAEELATRIRKL
jgi:glycosyltransferase involved in cell wall biosynthesis